MRHLVLLLAATSLAASPAAAQHTGHHMPMPQQPAAKKAPAKKKPAAKKPAAKKPVAKKKPSAKKAPTKKAPTKKTPAKKAPAKKIPAKKPAPKPQADPHAGHQTPAPEQPVAGPHAGHDMSQMTVPEPQPGPPPPEALTGPAHAADLYWDRREQARGRNILREEHGDVSVGRFLVDRAETRIRDGRNGYLADIQAWYGGDIDKLWLKSEVEGSWGGKLEHTEVQALWSHAIGPWFDLQAGVRYDPQPGPNRSHLVLGVEGLAPYWWEVDGAVFLSNKGDVTARAEGEYDLLITQKLVLQPRAEVNFSLQDIPELAIGSGFTDAELGLRLRYQVSPLVAPYIGVEYEHAFGDTRDFRRAEGDKADGWNLLAGIRMWF